MIKAIIPQIAGLITTARDRKFVGTIDVDPESPEMTKGGANMYKNAKSRGINPSMSDDERRAQRASPRPDEMRKLKAVSSNDRWMHLLDEICGQEEVWTLLAPDGEPGGWYDSEKSQDVLPTWPCREFAEEFLSRKPSGWKVVPIPIDDWIDRVIPALSEAEFIIEAFPLIEQTGTRLPPFDFADELENHWKLFAKSLRF